MLIELIFPGSVVQFLHSLWKKTSGKYEDGAPWNYWLLYTLDVRMDMTGNQSTSGTRLSYLTSQFFGYDFAEPIMISVVFSPIFILIYIALIIGAPDQGLHGFISTFQNIRNCKFLAKG